MFQYIICIDIIISNILLYLILHSLPWQRQNKDALDCNIDNINLQILNYIVGIVIYISIGSNLTFSVRMVSFLGFLFFSVVLFKTGLLYIVSSTILEQR